MRSNLYQSYLADEILTADPVKLVILLYRGAIDAVGAARRHLAAGDIAARSKSITKATEIVAELVRSLDHERGGDLSLQLLRLYDCILALLVEANSKQQDPPLAQAESLLTTLFNGWQGVAEKLAGEPQVRATAVGRQMAHQQDDEESEIPSRISYSY